MKTIKAKVYMLPTGDKTGDIWKNRATDNLFPDVMSIVKNDLYSGHHLYFTTDPENDDFDINDDDRAFVVKADAGVVRNVFFEITAGEEEEEESRSVNNRL